MFRKLAADTGSYGHGGPHKKESPDVTGSSIKLEEEEEEEDDDRLDVVGIDDTRRQSPGEEEALGGVRKMPGVHILRQLKP
jgi:hypothetical protein